MVENRLRIIVASNNDWVVPTGIGDRRWFVLDVANTFAGTGHREYWDALYAEIENGGAAAMFYDLLTMDLSGFDVRAVPHTAAKAQQQAHSLIGTEAWLYHVLQEGGIGAELGMSASPLARTTLTGAMRSSVNANTHGDLKSKLCGRKKFVPRSASLWRYAAENRQ